jgi:hypothetical protein
MGNVGTSISSVGRKVHHCGGARGWHWGRFGLMFGLNRSEVRRRLRMARGVLHCDKDWEDMSADQVSRVEIARLGAFSPRRGGFLFCSHEAYVTDNGAL